MVLLRRLSSFAQLALLASSSVACAADSAGTGGAGGSGAVGTTSATGASTSTGTPSATSATTGAGTGGMPSCTSLPTGPIDPSPFVMTLDGSEDLAFDGKGHIAAKRGAEIVLVDAVGQAAHLADLPDNVFGLRYRADGSLVAAVFGQGQLAEIAPNGQVGVLASGFGLPNGVFPDAQGNVWVTETSANKVSRVNPDKSTTVVVPTAPTANGVVLDETRHVLFYTDYAAGKLMRVDTAGASSPTLVGTVTDGKLDGLVLDECGNVYAVDQGNSKLYRFELDAAGDAKGEAKLLATFPKNVANAQFGSGPGFVATSLYVTGTPGTIYELPVGVKGAAVVTPP